MKKLLSIGILFILSLSTLLAQEVTFTAYAPKSVVVGERFQLVYKLNTEGSDLRQPSVSNVEFIYGPSTSTSTSVSIINGKVTRNTEYTYTYMLRANKEGNITIPPATILVNGNKIESNQLQLEALKKQNNTSTNSTSSTPSSSTNEDASGFNNDDLFVKCICSKTNLYKGEPAVISTKIYTRVNLEGISGVKSPDLRDFIAQDLKGSDQLQWSKETINNKTYNVGTFNQKLVFPQKSGKIVIEPIEIETLVQQRVSRRSRSIFDDFFDSGYRTVKKNLVSNKITLNVKTLPANPPASFKGDVGQLDMNVSITKSDLAVNDGATVKVIISGTGNHKLTNEPKIKFPADFDVYDPEIKNNISATYNGMKGTKTFEYLIIPRHSGDFTIPALEYSYFNPSTNKYKTISSEPIALSVAKGEQEEQTTTIAARITNREDVKFIGKDIRHIKSETAPLKAAGHFFFGGNMFYLLLFMPIMFLLFAFLIYRKQLSDNANMHLVKNKKANKIAVKRLKKSAHYLHTKEQEKFYDEVLKALWGYLSDKLSLPVSDLSKDNATDLLKKKGAAQEIIERFMQILDTCEFARFSPSSESSEMDKLYDNTIATISELEKEIKK